MAAIKCSNLEFKNSKPYRENKKDKVEKSKKKKKKRKRNQVV